MSDEAGPDAAGEGPPRNPQQAAAQKRIQHSQAQVNEVVGIMSENVAKVLERDAKISELDDRADALQQGASQFEQQAGKLKNKFWWKNCKMIIIMVVIGVVIVGIIGCEYILFILINLQKMRYFVVSRKTLKSTISFVLVPHYVRKEM
uniref:V-SNARE coiled-coil homology domain-containing protein n=1 Tax=Strigamia maritima TaxID=126957 RepID=T1JLB5_STRMM